MKKLHLEEEELKRLFNSSLPDTLPDDFTDHVIDTIMVESQTKSRLMAGAPSRSVAYGVCALLTMLVTVCFLLEPVMNVSSTVSFPGKEFTGNVHTFLNNPVFAVASFSVSLAVWVLIYIHTKVFASLPPSENS